MKAWFLFLVVDFFMLIVWLMLMVGHFLRSLFRGNSDPG